MGRNHKKVISESLKLASDLKIQVQFNNIGSNGEYLKPYATAVTIAGKELQTINGLQAWDNTTFRECFMPALKEYVTHEDITGHNIRTIADIEAYCKGSKTSVTMARGHKEYAKDSYHWAQIDLIDKFEIYQDSKMIFNFDDVETLDAFIDLQNQQKEFFKNFYIKMNNCNPNPDFWTSERLETYYITSKILPKFIREELHADFSEDNMNMICKLYFQSRDKDCKTIASEQFADTLHRLINDTKLSGSVLEVLGD